MCGYCEHWLGCRKINCEEVYDIMKEHENTCPEKPKDE